MSPGFPRLLVATEFSPNASGGGPAVVRQMLRDWPADRLFWWSCSGETEKPFGRDVAGHRVASIPKKLYPQRKLPRVKAWWLEQLWVPWAARQLRLAIRDFQPEAIWVIPHQWSILPLKTALSTSRIGFHVTMQDYADSRSNAARIGLNRGRRFAAAARLLYRDATTRDATSHPMIEDLERSTSCSAAQMLHAGLEQDDLRALGSIGSSTHPAIRIAYAGTIIVEDVFTAFVDALKSLRPKQNRPIELHLFSAHSYRNRPWFDPDWMSENGNLPEAELAARLKECTWGFAPMALGDDDPQYNRFSFPTKFISYLAAGLPIITLGHSRSSVTKMARDYRVGICLDESNAGDVASALGVALNLPEPRRFFREEITRCARQEFDATKMRHTLHRCFEECVRATNQSSACGSFIQR